MTISNFITMVSFKQLVENEEPTPMDVCIRISGPKYPTIQITDYDLNGKVKEISTDKKGTILFDGSLQDLVEIKEEFSHGTSLPDLFYLEICCFEVFIPEPKLYGKSKYTVGIKIYV